MKSSMHLSTHLKKNNHSSMKTSLLSSMTKIKAVTGVQLSMKTSQMSLSLHRTPKKAVKPSIKLTSFKSLSTVIHSPQILDLRFVH